MRSTARQTTLSIHVWVAPRHHEVMHGHLNIRNKLGTTLAFHTTLTMDFFREIDISWGEGTEVTVMPIERTLTKKPKLGYRKSNDTGTDGEGVLSGVLAGGLRRWRTRRPSVWGAHGSRI